MKKIILTCLILFPVLTMSQWVQMSNGMGSRCISALTAGGNNLFAAADSTGVYLSADNGASWTQTPLNNDYVYSLAANDDYLIAGTGHGVYLSANNGANWTKDSLYLKCICLAIGGDNFFAGSELHGLYISANRGSSWTASPLYFQTVEALALTGDYIFAGARYYRNSFGLYVSTNNGANWTVTLKNQWVISLTVSGNLVFAGTQESGKVYLPGLTYSSMDTGNGVYLSADMGTSWTQTSLNNRNILALAANGNSVFAGTDTGGLFVSNSSGTSWIQKNEGLGNETINVLSILGKYIFAGTKKGVYRRQLSELIVN